MFAVAESRDSLIAAIASFIVCLSCMFVAWKENQRCDIGWAFLFIYFLYQYLNLNDFQFQKLVYLFQSSCLEFDLFVHEVVNVVGHYVAGKLWLV